MTSTGFKSILAAIAVVAITAIVGACSATAPAPAGKLSLSDEPLPGKFPFPGLGPFDLLGISFSNYIGKMMFRWVYWNLLLKGAELPIEAQMNMAGKRQ